MCVRIVLQKHNSRPEHAAPFVLYRVLQLIQGLTLCCCIDCHASSEEFNQQNSLPVTEHGAHDFCG
jgi:hypothetical protein